MHRLIAIGLLAVVGCGSNKTDKTRSDDTKQADAAATSAAGASEKNAAKRKRLPPAYRKALEKGRALVGQKKYSEAAAAFREALAVVGGDARANSELSLALYLAKNYPGAEAAARASVRSAGGVLKAASLYNLALALEKQGDKDGAIEALRQSLALRPHEVVAKKLAKLAGGNVTDPLAPAEWDGPYPTIEAFCAAIKERDETPDWMCPAEKRQVSIEGAGRFSSVIDLVVNKERHDGYILLQTDKGWFASDVYYATGSSLLDEGSGKVARASVIRPGGIDVLRLDLETHEEHATTATDYKFSWFCAAPGAAVKCTPSIYTSVSWADFANMTDDGDIPDTDTSDKEFTLGIGDDAVLTVTANRGTEVEADYRGQLGEHKLEF